MQLNLFEAFESHSEESQETLNIVFEPKYQKGDTVLVDKNQMTEMDRDYFAYYYPYVLKKSGIVDISHITAQGIIQYRVNFLGEHHWINEYELL